MKLKDKVAIVTGSGRGIGYATAIEMSRHGAAVVVNDIDADLVEAAVEDIRAEGGRAEGCVASVAEMAGAEEIVRTAVERLGGLDILVNNAGIVRDQVFWRMSEDEWDEVMAVNLRGPFCLTRAAVEPLRERGGGAILNLTSTSGLRGNVGQANYCAAKLGLVGMTRSLALELARLRIRVNAVAPGARTRLTQQLPEEEIRRRAAADPRWLRLLDLPPPEDVAPLLVYLASDEAADITGRIFYVSGNRLALWEMPRQARLAFAPERWDVERLGRLLREALLSE